MVTAPEDSKVRVVVRVRPPTPRELEGQRPPVVQVVDDRVLVFDPEELTEGLPALKWGSAQNGPKRKNRDRTFIFDQVFGEGATQQDVFQHTTQGLLDSFLQGYNCSVFAYGATGAGKTHTMLGQHGDPGIMYLTTMELYRRLEALKEEKRFEVLVSYLEVYNEQIRDLLEPKGPLNIREDSDKSVVVRGLSFHQPASAEQLLEMLSRGNHSRTQHPTDANATSSRSHAIFQIFVRQQDRALGPTQTLQVAKMSLVDLAGSERASSTHAHGERLREGANINRSLLALISVLNALADAKGRRAHVPYRDSKLTRLLKDSLGGNCRTVMIANVSPASMAYEDTYNTLKYADRAKEIRLALKSNVVSLDCHVSHYATVCQQLQAEVLSLKRKLQELQERAQAPLRLVVRVLRLAQQQCALLQAAGLLTPDLTTELETLQQLVHEADSGSRAESCRTPDVAQLYSEPRFPGHYGPVTRTMARRQSSLLHDLRVTPGPDSTPGPVSQQLTGKRRRRSPTEFDSPLAPAQEAKRQRQSPRPCPRPEGLPEPRTSTGAQAPATYRSLRPCPATIIKCRRRRRTPLGPSALQNCSTPLVPPILDLNTTVDLSEELPSTLGFKEFAPQEQPRQGQAFVASRPAALFTARGPKPMASLPGATTCRRKRRPVSSSIPQGRSRIARLASSSLKRPTGLLSDPEPPSRPKTQEKLARVGRLLPAGGCVTQVS